MRGEREVGRRQKRGGRQTGEGEEREKGRRDGIEGGNIERGRGKGREVKIER